MRLPHTFRLLATALASALMIASVQARDAVADFQVPLPKTAADVPGPPPGTAMTTASVG